MTGIVTQHLLAKLHRQIEQERVVVWYDPEPVYAVASDALAADPGLLPVGAQFARYDGSFFGLRHRIEPLIGGLEPLILPACADTAPAICWSPIWQPPSPALSLPRWKP